MWLSNFVSRRTCLSRGNSQNVPLRSITPTFQGLPIVITILSVLLIASTSAADIRKRNLLPTRLSRERETGENSESHQLSGSRHGRTLMEEQASNEEENEREPKQTFRLELLRQIKAIDHMKCFPKVLCGLSVDSDKSFGVNKSNFVRSYLELMRNIKPPQEGAEERLRTEDEVEGELLWPFSPHNPDRKHHSSFERISSAAMSGSVELVESSEYQRGLDSRVHDELSSTSIEKVDRRGELSVESKEKLSLSKSPNRMDSSVIPGEKKKKKNSNKSLKSKLTSYFTSWLPDLASFSSKNKGGDSAETELDLKRDARSINDGNYNSWPISEDILSNVPELHSLIKRSRKRRAEGDVGAAVESTDDDAARDDIQPDSGEHDVDMYHTAVSIGKRLKDPKQCDYIYNGCPLEYDNILSMISTIRTGINHDDTAEAVSQELGFDVPTTTSTTTSTTTTTTTKKPQRKRVKPRPSTKIMHTLPNGEKVEINFRLGGREDSEESSSSAQRDLDKKELSEESSSEKDSKGADEVMVVDVGQQSSLSSEEENGETKVSNRKGSAPEVYVFRKSNKKKIELINSKIKDDVRSKDLERSEELDLDEEKASPPASLHKEHNSKIKLGGLTLTSKDGEKPLEISPSYVIIKHQPLSVHTTSLLRPDNIQPQSVAQTADKLHSFQLIQGGQKIDGDQMEQLKNYIRQNGGLIPKLSLHSSGLITTDASAANPQKQFFFHQTSSGSDTSSSSSPVPQKSHFSFLNPSGGLASEGMKNPLSQSFNIPFAASFPESAYSSYSFKSNVPEMVGAVPGRLGDLSTTTSTTTTSTTTEKILLPGMAETVMLDTDEITDDTMKKLSPHEMVPGWITPSPSPTSEPKGKDKHASLLENLSKTLLSEDKSNSKIRYKNPKKKRTRVKANSSRVRTSSSSKRNKNKSNSEEGSGERVVIKHAGPYSSSPTVYKSPLKGPGPHGGAYPYLPMGGMQPSVFQGYPPFWRL